MTVKGLLRSVAACAITKHRAVVQVVGGGTSTALQLRVCLRLWTGQGSGSVVVAAQAAAAVSRDSEQSCGKVTESSRVCSKLLLLGYAAAWVRTASPSCAGRTGSHAPSKARCAALHGGGTVMPSSNPFLC